MVLRCSEPKDNHDGKDPSSSSSSKSPPPSTHSKEHGPSSSFAVASDNSTSSFLSCSWLWGWMIQASTPSSLMIYPSCGEGGGGEGDDDDDNNNNDDNNNKDNHVVDASDKAVTTSATTSEATSNLTNSSTTIKSPQHDAAVTTVSTRLDDTTTTEHSYYPCFDAMASSSSESSSASAASCGADRQNQQNFVDNADDDNANNKCKEALQVALTNLLRQEIPFEIPNARASTTTILLLAMNNGGGTCHMTKIRHVAQQETWDCGVACMQMILDWLRRDDDSNNSNNNNYEDDNGENDGTTTLVKFHPWLEHDQQAERQWMLELLGTTSIWTIDLVCLLDKLLSTHSQSPPSNHRHDMPKTTTYPLQQPHQHPHPHPHPLPQQQQQQQQQHATDASYLFLSKTLGVNDSHSGIRYYQRAFLDDQRRVEALFQQRTTATTTKATRHCQNDYETHSSNNSNSGGGCIVQIPHVAMEVVVALVSRPNCIAMVLVDNSLLSQEEDDTMPNNPKDTYQGHYVIVCGICPRDSSNSRNSSKNVPLERYNGDDNDGNYDDSYRLALLNPARSDPTVEWVSPRRFERAWRATGTDDDIVFIVKHAVS